MLLLLYDSSCRKYSYCSNKIVVGNEKALTSIRSFELRFFFLNLSWAPPSQFVTQALSKRQDENQDLRFCSDRWILIGRQDPDFFSRVLTGLDTKIVSRPSSQDPFFCTKSRPQVLFPTAYVTRNNSRQTTQPPQKHNEHPRRKRNNQPVAPGTTRRICKAYQSRTTEEA